MKQADTFLFSDQRQVAKGVKLPRAHRFAVVGKTGVYVMEHVEAGCYDIDLVKLAAESEIAKSLPIAIMIIPAQHAFAWAAVTAARAAELLDHLKAKALN